MDYKLLGLTEYEESAYKTLVRLGKSSAANVSKESGVSYGKIYTVLDSLERKGLVKVIPETSKKFVASDPQNLIRLAEEREKELKKLKKAAEELKQEYDFHEREPVRIVKGKRNFYKIAKDLPKEEIYNYTIKYSSEFYHEWVKHTRNSQDSPLETKTLARVHPETIKNLERWEKEFPGYGGRTIENNGVAMTITDKVVIIVLIKQNTIMTIEDRALSDVLKQLMDAFYDKAEPVTATMAKIGKEK